MRRRSSPRNIQRPKHLPPPPERLNPQVIRNIRKRIVRLGLRAVLVKGNRVVQGVADLSENLELVFVEPDVVEVIACEGCGDGEAREGVAVAEAEPGFGRGDEGFDVAGEEGGAASTIRKFLLFRDKREWRVQTGGCSSRR
jgi:hypothetical protein